MMTYPMHVAGLVRDLPICKVTEDFYIGAFIMFGDAELTVACARDLLKLAEELADVLGGVVGGSRVAIDSGWLTADHQVGQTGKTVHPKVYIALGISGSIQHKAGMSESECIIAVNKNETAPIFEIADYGICGDLFKVTPMLIEAIKAAKAAK